jgi:chromosome segregation protein
MRLQSIKLSGFKSFAEPTHFQLPGQLVGVVGPNGCGKSNIMDAVRWVLGESKASELRGESMQDVIFNGSGNRKPASRSSVELVFDNTAARAGGQWNQFSEIAVKRVLTRDGTSSYYINNQPVRRRDVQDVFLGTGLGPRAYAIIGQGTISRIIESRPEELRLFLEEAAGVSKYKERRRETEHRLRDTRENLTRVEDILRELNANLERCRTPARSSCTSSGS